MRLDLYLKNVCLLKSRSMASREIDEGRVLVNGDRVKASREIRAGDIIEMTSGRIHRKVKVMGVPSGQVSKVLSRDCYAVLEERPLLDDLW